MGRKKSREGDREKENKGKGTERRRTWGRGQKEGERGQWEGDRKRRDREKYVGRRTGDRRANRDRRECETGGK